MAQRLADAISPAVSPRRVSMVDLPLSFRETLQFLEACFIFYFQRQDAGHAIPFGALNDDDEAGAMMRPAP
jgi:hypothetical protein